MVPALRFQNLQLGRPWPGKNPSLSEMLSDNETFHGFAKTVDAFASNRAQNNAFSRKIDAWREYQHAETKASELTSKLADVIDQQRRQIDEIFNKPTTAQDVMFVAGDDGKVSMFAVPHGRRMGLYFETDAAMRAFRSRLDDTGLAPLPRYAMPEPVSNRIELESGLPFIIADEITWKTVTMRNPRLIDLWLNPPAYKIVSRDGVDVFAPTFAPMPSRAEVAGDLAIKIGDRVVVNSGLDAAGDVQIVVGFPHYSDDDDLVVTVPEGGSGQNWTINRANVMFVGYDLKKALECRAFYLRAKPGYLRKEAFDA